MSTRTTKQYQAGLTLIELVLFIVVVSVGIAGVLSVMNLVNRTGANPLPRKQAMVAAEALLEEIQLKAYANPAGGFAGPYTQANRPQFDDIFDYNGFSTAGILSADGTATPINGLSGYAVNVTVTANAGADLVLPAAQAARIRVTVTTPGSDGVAISIDGYRTNHP